MARNNGNNGNNCRRGQEQNSAASAFANADINTVIAVAASIGAGLARGDIGIAGLGLAQDQSGQGGQSQGGAQASQQDTSGGQGSGRQGFASMPTEQVREIAAQGGRASHGGGRTAGSRNGDGNGNGRPGAPVNPESAMQVARNFYNDNVDSDMSRRDMINAIVEKTGRKKSVINTYISNIDKENGGALSARSGRGKSAGATDGRRNNRPPSRAASAKGGRNSGGKRTGTNG